MLRFGLLSSLFLFCTTLTFGQTERSISQTELKDKLHAFWVGQLVGNYMGFPFELVYVEEPVPALLDHYYGYTDASTDLRLNNNDARGFVPILSGLQGVLNGMDGIPDNLKYEVARNTTWAKPFNDTYINFSRDHLPVYTKISDMVERTLRTAERAIFEAGGQKITKPEGI